MFTDQTFFCDSRGLLQKLANEVIWKYSACNLQMGDLCARPFFLRRDVHSQFPTFCNDNRKGNGQERQKFTLQRCFVECFKVYSLENQANIKPRNFWRVRVPSQLKNYFVRGVFISGQENNSVMDIPLQTIKTPFERC